MSNRIKRAVIEAIGNSLDEVSIPPSFRRTPDQMGFIETYGPFIHVADEKDYNFQIFLKEVDDFDIGEQYDPEARP